MRTNMSMIITATPTIITMTTDAAALYRLMAWLSPSYPVGAFSHSHGLEWAVEAGDVGDREGLRSWIADVMTFGGGRQDAILLAAAWRATMEKDWAAFEELGELAAALAPSRERQAETMSQGTAFHRATVDAWPSDGWTPAAGEALAYPVAVGHAAARHGLALEPVIHAYLHAFAANLVSAGLRLFSIGQTEGQRVLAALEPVTAEIASEANDATLDDLGGSALLADIASMRHETQYTRLFRT